ncbi:kinase-like domain-containing protein [Suillus ampliporus]|nr:kinase-like domain-containing protein [Suillus ampliporus]
MAVAELWLLRAEQRQLAEGTFGRVYKATQVSTGHILALKKSRAYLTLQPTLLNHERLILQHLQGHPSIPRVLAYGRLEHFEYLAMELLWMDLEDARRRRPSLPAVHVLVVADQMISALKHIHKNGLVHCDLKPGNILLHPTDPKRLYLVDYRLTRAIASTTKPSHSLDVPLRSHGIIGTLAYVSLNMHYGILPAPRDDIESLGYVLFSIAQGDLPWTHNVQHGTRRTRQDQVRIKSSDISALTLPPMGYLVFGQMVDYARSLKFDFTRLRAPTFAYTRDSCASWLARLFCRRLAYPSRGFVRLSVRFSYS